MINIEEESEFRETPHIEDNPEPRSHIRSCILSYWDSDLHQDQIGLKCRCRHSTVKAVFIEEFGLEALRMRQKLNYSRSKLGKSNPMYGKKLEEHHNYIGRASDSKGYWTVVKPGWYYAPTKKRVFEHHVTYCKHYGLSHIPDDFQVHHLDFNPGNNDPTNLIMLKQHDHMKLHAWLKRNEYGLRCNDYPERE